ncbi:MAG: hypothetical protein ABIV10_12445 [Gemmatimonadaceae bacterium]
MSPSRGRAALIIAAIVIGSAIAGAGLDRVLVMRGSRHYRGGGPRSGEMSLEMTARRRAAMLERMSKDLSLTPLQRAAIDSIMQQTDSSLRVVRGEMQPRLTQIFDQSRAEIGARLDSTQREKFKRRPRHGRGRP